MGGTHSHPFKTKKVMAIQKRFIHFKKFSDFNSKKLSANEANTQYTVGVDGEVEDGAPDVLYQSYCWIKDTKQQWTHGQLYDGSVAIPDWSEEDSESKSFIKNKTHYATVLNALGEVNLGGYEANAILFTKLAVGAAYKITNQIINSRDKAVLFTAKDGLEIIIPANGPTQRAVCEATEEGFCQLRTLTDGYGINNILTLHYCSVVKLGEAYIPENIARVADVPTKLSDLENDLGIGSNDYITEFTYNDFYTAAIDESTLSISQAEANGLLEACSAGKRILMPFDSSDTGGYVRMDCVIDDMFYVATQTPRERVCVDIDLNALINERVIRFDPENVSIVDVYVRKTEEIVPYTIPIRDTNCTIGANGLIDDSGNVWVTPTSSAKVGANYEFQQKLVSGENIKTINGQSILGSGNIIISGDGSSSGGSNNSVNEWIDLGDADEVTLSANKVYYRHILSSERYLNFWVKESLSKGETATIILYNESTSLSLDLPGNLFWANGNIPDFSEIETMFEISFLQSHDTLFATYVSYITGMSGTSPT